MNLNLHRTGEDFTAGVPGIIPTDIRFYTIGSGHWNAVSG